MSFIVLMSNHFPYTNVQLFCYVVSVTFELNYVFFSQFPDTRLGFMNDSGISSVVWSIIYHSVA